MTVRLQIKVRDRRLGLWPRLNAGSVCLLPVAVKKHYLSEIMFMIQWQMYTVEHLSDCGNFCCQLVPGLASSNAFLSRCLAVTL